MKAQNSEIIGGNTLAQAVLSFMDDKDHWEGTVAEAFLELRDLVRSNDKDRTFPKAPNKLRKHLERIKPNLQEYGVRFVIDDFHATKGMPIRFQKIPKGSSVSSYPQETRTAEGLRIEDTANIPQTIPASSGVSSGEKPTNSRSHEHTEHTEDKNPTFWDSKEFVPEIEDPDSGGWES